MQITQDRTDEERIMRATLVARAAFAMKAERLVALDVRALTSYADTLVLMTGGSDRHVRAIADSIIDAVKARGEKPLGVEGHDEGRWVLIDLGDVIAHVFQSEVRDEYDLERLWSDAPPLEIADPAA
jgi:ribosome-associated protein